MDTTCYNSIIGLSRQACLDCLTPADGDDLTSLSGLYLDEIAELDSVDGLRPCTNQTVWDIMTLAREQGVLRFMGEINGMIASRYKKNRTNWNGFLGRTKHLESYEQGAGNYAGIRIAPAPVRGGVLRIKAINTLFREAGTIVVKVYDSLNRLLATRTVATLAGYKENALESVIELPLYDKALSNNLEYFVVYESLLEASLNETYCGCGGFDVRYNCENPYYGMMAKSDENRWSQWLMLGGWEGTTLTDFHDVASTAPARAYGLILDVDIFCNSSEVICKDTVKFDGSDVLSFSIAYAILYASADYLAMRLLSSTKVERTIMMNRESLTIARREFTQKYIEHVTYIADNLDIERNDCLGCQSPIEIRITKTLI